MGWTSGFLEITETWHADAFEMTVGYLCFRPPPPPPPHTHSVDPDQIPQNAAPDQGYTFSLTHILVDFPILISWLSPISNYRSV